MKKYLIVISSFIIMLCLGGVYAWSIIASALIKQYNLSALKTQIIFGALILIFPLTMIFSGKLSSKLKLKYYGYLSGGIFLLGYLIAGFSIGNFLILLIGYGILSGIATGFGYWVSLTAPIQQFPERKGLIAGIAAGGFGLGSVVMSELSKAIIDYNMNILEFIKLIGLFYGVIILIFSNFIYQPQKISNKAIKIKINEFIFTSYFNILFLGIFLGTFAGLLIIGSLKLIGEQYNLSTKVLINGIILFSIANFLGRLFWGFMSDKIGANFCIFAALLLQGSSIISLNISLNEISYLIISFLIGFGFGGNFSLFAKETAAIYGVEKMGIIYPYVFLGYAIAGLIGPVSGGFLYDIANNFTYSILLASLMSFLGSIIYLMQHIKEKKVDRTSSLQSY